MAMRIAHVLVVFVFLFFNAYFTSAEVCLPDLWEGEFISVSPFHMVYGKTAIDVKGQRISNYYERKRHHHGEEKLSFTKSKKARVIADFKKGTEYIIFLRPDDSVCGCVKRPIRGPAFAPSCAKNAELVRNITIGGKLDVNVYKVVFKHGVVLLALAEGSNLPISTVFLFHLFEIETKYFNVHDSIKDTSIFDIPPECESPSLYTEMPTEGVMADQFVLRGRSMMRDQKPSPDGTCPPFKKMLKKGKRLHTFASSWHREGDEVIDVPSVVMGDERVESALTQYFNKRDESELRNEEDEDGLAERGERKWSFGSWFHGPPEELKSGMEHHHDDEDDDHNMWSNVKAWFGHGHHEDDDQEHEGGKWWHKKHGHHEDDDHHDDDDHEHGPSMWWHKKHGHHEDDDDDHEHGPGMWGHKRHDHDGVDEHHDDEDHGKWGWKGHEGKHRGGECRKWATHPVDVLLGVMQ